MQGNGSGVEGPRHHAGIHQHDGLYPHRPLPCFELVRVEARRYGVSIVGSEIIGLVPMEALIDTASYYLGLENFSMEQVLEARM
mgnify:CR=1 FL=1